MLSLSDQLTVPQVFFNQVHVGNAANLLDLLTQQDNKEQGGSLSYYEKKIKPEPDPTDPRLRLEAPTTDDEGDDLKHHSNHSEKSSDECSFGCFVSPDGKSESIREVTMGLINFMPRSTLPFYAKYYNNCFPGSVGVDALMERYPQLKSRRDAVSYGLALQKLGVIHHVCNQHKFKDTKNLYFRLQPFHEPNILNSFKKSFRCYGDLKCTVAPLDPMELVEKLRTMIQGIETRATTPNGVDYIAASEDPMFKVFEEEACELQCISMGEMEEKTKIPFSINLYNVMIKHAYIKVGIPEDSANRGAFFGGIGYDVGGYTLSFDDLEHGILRANTRHPYHFKPIFSKSDPRLSFKVSELDPKIHFVLNCGANSCPPVGKYTVEAIEEEMRIAATAFCLQNNNVVIDEDKYELSLSMLFKWYRSDFCSSPKRLPYKIAEYLTGEKKEKLERMLESKKPIKIKYLTYDWGAFSVNNTRFERAALSNYNVSLLACFKKQAARRLSKSDRSSNSLDITAAKHIEEHFHFEHRDALEDAWA